MYVGEREKVIGRKFRDTDRQGAVLVFDEVDIFLQDRRAATQHHQVQQVNPFLTSLESYGGVPVGTTDRLDNLDQATLRSFDVRVKPDYPDEKGIRALLEYLADAVDLSVESWH